MCALYKKLEKDCFDEETRKLKNIYCNIKFQKLKRIAIYNSRKYCCHKQHHEKNSTEA